MTRETITKTIETIDRLENIIHDQDEKIEALEETVDLYAQLVEEYETQVRLLTTLLSKASAQERRKT